ncbi:hypothetical protein RCL_jg6311.t1 [Rhizophagus clarus]|uniref:Uncharacterized protein n=1 Tax=Rhizophagus clarus TaxID=94130 RepID=A0A8H3L4Z9_9GLOM|nr:hypothetical protein RCL_jg6311.t1 [Rhizophagus clarus]
MNFKGLQLPNTTGLNFEDLASKHNFEDPRLSKCLIDRISEKKVTFEINEKSNSEDEFEEYEETETFDTQDLKEEEITSEEDEAK